MNFVVRPETQRASFWCWWKPEWKNFTMAGWYNNTRNWCYRECRCVGEVVCLWLNFCRERHLICWSWRCVSAVAHNNYVHWLLMWLLMFSKSTLLFGSSSICCHSQICSSYSVMVKSVKNLRFITKALDTLFQETKLLMCLLLDCEMCFNLCFLLQYKTCFHCSSSLFFYFSQQTTLFWVEVEVTGL